MKRTLLAALLAALLDQLTKALVAHEIAAGEAVAVTPFFQLVAVHNPGAAFSLLAGAAGWQRWFFLALALAVSVWLLWEARRSREPVAQLAYGLIVGGALGNSWDRLAHGAVFDFLLLHYRQWAWPAFNLADTAITLGVALLLAWQCKEHRDERT